MSRLCNYGLFSKKPTTPEDALLVGDVIEIKIGMKVYAKIPEKFVYSNAKLSDKLARTNIRIGETRENKIGVLTYAEISKNIQKVFVHDVGIEIDVSKINDFVIANIGSYKTETFDTSIFVGEYVVVKANLEGGGTGHGQNDVYPDGWNVICKKLTPEGKYDENGLEVSFYQSGCFTVIHKPNTIIPIRKMKMETTFK